MQSDGGGRSPVEVVVTAVGGMEGGTSKDDIGVGEERRIVILPSSASASAALATAARQSV